ncbi:MAG: flagellar protein FlgN [Lachnospiraceae bacterium]|nr:flagellar protein FlgN [Lachnospiraceae bacterium]
MASLIEKLMDTLEQECGEYETLLGISRKKTPVIVAGNLDELATITDEEQVVVNRISHIDQTRYGIMQEIANVLNTDVKNLKLDMLIRALEKRPVERQKLAEVSDRLGNAVHLVRSVNLQNQELINSALEMVNFEMNMIQAMRKAPETANYNKGAYNTGDVIGTEAGSFDAKQ